MHQKLIENLTLEPLVKPIADEAIFVNQSGNQINLTFGFPFESYAEEWQRHIKNYLADESIEVILQSKIKAHRVQSGLKGLPDVKNIIAVASGKGGVGKSTTTTNLALALSQLGARVGVLDADIYGPSQPLMLGVAEQKPESVEGKYLKPVESYHGIQVMSMGFLIQDDNTPVVWRGPMVSKALQQLLFETLWDDLDYLLIDLPPGTGDIQLTLCQKIPLSGAIIVTTPQDVALLDVKKAMQMFKQVEVPCIGVVENMSYYHCPNCQHEDPIFGQGGAQKLEQAFAVPCLGQIPLNTEICTQADRGEPVTLNEQSPIRTHYLSTAIRFASRLALQAQNYAVKFPNIVIKTE